MSNPSNTRKVHSVKEFGVIDGFPVVRTKSVQIGFAGGKPHEINYEDRPDDSYFGTKEVARVVGSSSTEIALDEKSIEAFLKAVEEQENHVAATVDGVKKYLADVIAKRRAISESIAKSTGISAEDAALLFGMPPEKQVVVEAVAVEAVKA